MPLSASEAGFLSLAVESILYGVYTIVVSISLAILFSKRSQIPVSVKSSTSVAISFLFALSTVYILLDITSGFKSLDTHASQETLTRATDALFSIIAFFSELVLIHRCWAIWTRNYLIIILPLLSSIASLVSGLIGIALIASTPPHTAFPAVIIPLGTSSFIISLCVNFTTTVLIILRIWLISRTVKKIPAIDISHNRVKRAMEIMVESGLAILLFELIFVILFATNNVAQSILASILSQVYGIAPTLLIVRVGMGEADERGASDMDQTIPISYRSGVDKGNLQGSPRGFSPEKNRWVIDLSPV